MTLTVNVKYSFSLVSTSGAYVCVHAKKHHHFGGKRNNDVAKMFKLCRSTSVLHVTIAEFIVVGWTFAIPSPELRAPSITKRKKLRMQFWAIVRIIPEYNNTGRIVARKTHVQFGGDCWLKYAVKCADAVFLLLLLLAEQRLSVPQTLRIIFSLPIFLQGTFSYEVRNGEGRPHRENEWKSPKTKYSCS